MTLTSYKRSAFSRRAAPSSRWGRLRAKITRKRLVIVLCTLLVLLVGWLGWKFIYNGSKIFGGNIFGLFSSTRLRGEDVGRVNILLAGNSADDAGHNGGNLTDSIMLISLDTRNHTGYMVSIPRDLWVDIPGYGYHKINAAYVYGQNDNFQESGYAKGGMGLLEKVVEQSLQVPINYYGLVNYTAFKDAVNAVGGIKIKINSDDPRGLYDPNIDWSTHGPLVKLSNGWHELSGREALDLARARGDAYGAYGFAGSDFTRTANQRQMLVALKNKALSSSTLANPLKLSGLMDALGKNVKTDFKTSEVHRLYDITKQISNSSIKSMSLKELDGKKDLLVSYTSPTGESALSPAAGVGDFSEISMHLKRLFSNDPIVKESAKVVLLNGTNSYGLAARKSKELEAKGINVTMVSDARSVATSSTIIDNSRSRKPATKRLLINQYGSNITTTNSYTDIYPDADFIVVLGQDQLVR